MYKNTWMFDIKEMETKRYLRTLCFFGVDSEEAHTNCIEWCESNMEVDCIADLANGEEIHRDESRRLQKTQEQQFLNEIKELKESFKTVLKSRKINSVKEIEV